MGTETAVGFMIAARRLCDEARRRGLVAPGFRSPPRIAGVQRSLRWIPGGSAVVAVARCGRDGAEVLTDMVDGVVVANGLTGVAADELRADLLAAVA